MQCYLKIGFTEKKINLCKSIICNGTKDYVIFTTHTTVGGPGEWNWICAMINLKQVLAKIKEYARYYTKKKENADRAYSIKSQNDNIQLMFCNGYVTKWLEIYNFKNGDFERIKKEMQKYI